MRTESQTFLSPRFFFPTPLEKRRGEGGKKIGNLSFATISWVTWLAAYPHWPPEPESQWVQQRQPGPGVRPSLFTSIGRECRYSKRFLPPWALCPAWRKKAVGPRSLAAVDSDGASSTLRASPTFVLCRECFRDRWWGHVQWVPGVFSMSQIRCGPYTWLAKFAFSFTSYHFMCCVDILPHECIWPNITYIYIPQLR